MSYYISVRRIAATAAVQYETIYEQLVDDIDLRAVIDAVNPPRASYITPGATMTAGEYAAQQQIAREAAEERE